MAMTLRLRNCALTAHIISSVGWLGAVAAFLALAVAGLASRDAQMVCAAYLAMELTGWFVIVPLSFASPLTGLVQSLGTPWGLFRHYWVLVKVLITIPCTLLLLVHMQATARLVDVAAETTLSGAGLGALQTQLVADAGAALLVLSVATTLAVHKPRGMTRYGARQRHERSVYDDTAAGLDRGPTPGTPGWVKVILIALVSLLVLLRLGFTAHGPHAH